MQVVTLTTDFGHTDFYAGALKGSLLSALPSGVISDISHHIEKFDIAHAAYVVSNAYRYYPLGTLHLIAVHAEPFQVPYGYLFAERNGHIFLTPNNGLLTLLFGDHAEDVWQIDALPDESIYTYLGRIVALLFSEEARENYARANITFQQRIGLNPVVTKNKIRGMITHIDHYGNVVTNVHQSLLEKHTQNSTISIFFRKHDPITCISETYNDVPLGDPLGFFNTAGFLEIAINTGNASMLLGLKKEDIIEISI